MSMRFLFCAAGLFASVLAADVAMAAPPNDTCANAQVITVPGLNTRVTVSGTNDNATTDVEMSSCSNFDDFDVWYVFTAPAAGNYTFDTIDRTGSTSLDDTTLSIYNVCGGPEIACNDDIDPSGNFLSTLTLPMTMGRTVRIRVAGYNEGTGTFKLNVIGTTTPTNDVCVSAETIVLNEVKSGNTAGADTDLFVDDAACGIHAGSGGQKDVFYSFTPTTTGAYKVSLCGSGFNTVLAVLADCTGDPASVLACNDDSASCPDGTNSQIASVALAGGTTYLVRVAGTFDDLDTAFGPYSLIIQSAQAGMGVCCRGATCAVIAQAGCTASGTAGAAFVASAGACNTQGTPSTPCCYADYNKAGGITVQDIFDFLSDWFASSPYASVGGSGSPAPLTVQNIFDFLSAWFSGGCT